MPKHKLSPLSEKIPSYDLYAFDIETTGKDNQFLMGSIVGKYQKVVFWNKEDMINCFLNNHCFIKGSRIMATNLYFDLMVLFQDTEHMP